MPFQKGIHGPQFSHHGFSLNTGISMKALNGVKVGSTHFQLRCEMDYFKKIISNSTKLKQPGSIN
jgi:hypothetical protein